MKFGHVVRNADALLRQWIKSSKIQAGSRLPSVREIAQTLGVPYYGINRAMATLTAERVIERKGYKLFLAMPKNEATSAVCDVVVAKNSIYVPIYRKVAKELGIQISTHLWVSTEEAVSILNRFLVTPTKGILFAPPSEHFTASWEKSARQLFANGIPFICVGQQSAYLPSVVTDDNQALEETFQYLLEQGHQHIALFTPSPWAYASSGIISQWNWLCKKYDLPESKERVSNVSGLRFIPEQIQRLATHLLHDWKEVSALVAYIDNEYPVQQFINEFKRQGLTIPDKLSLVFIGDTPALHNSTPTVTATSADMSLLHETAYLLLKRLQRKKQELGVLPSPFTIHVQQNLIVRNSSRLGPFAQKAARTETPIPPIPDFWGNFIDPAATLDLYAAWHRPYELTLRTPDHQFAQIDLSQIVNRPYNFRRGWLGDLPLKNLQPGRNVIHGVPFNVLGGNSRAENGAVILRSLVNTMGSGKKLPQQVSIPVNMKSRAIYILHGCGYSNFLSRFAAYSFFSGKNKLEELPLVSLGRPDPGTKPDELDRAVAQCKIQDWWPDYPHHDFPQARRVPLAQEQNSEAIQRHVYLYTLEWINPHPEKVVTHIEVTSNIEQPTTLGILSVSVLQT